jgi:uncharacterized membrane protein
MNIDTARLGQGAQTAIVGLVCAIPVIALAVYLRTPDFPMDDAYIVQHSVESLRAGADGRFIGTPPLVGATSPSQVLLITALSVLMPTAWAQFIISGLGAVLYAAGAFHLAKRFGARILPAAGVALLSILAGMSVYHFFNGLETGLAMAAIMWSLILFFDPVPAKRRHFALLGLLPYIRPELAALSLILFARAALHEWTANRAGFIRSMALSAAWSVAGAAPIALFLLASGQPIIPNTVSAKALFFAEGCRPFLAKEAFAASLLFDGVVIMGLAALGFIAAVMSRFRWVAVGFFAAVFAAYSLTLPGALAHNHHRYLYILIPLAIAGWASLLGVQDRRMRLGAWAGLGLAVFVSAIGFATTWSLYNRGLDISRVELRGVAEWVRDNVPETATVLVHDAGYISEVGRQPLVDIVGLKTLSSIEAHRAFTWHTCGPDARAIDMIASRAGASYMVVLKDWDDLFHFTSGLESRGWTLVRADAARGETMYEVYRLTPPSQSASLGR